MFLSRSPRHWPPAAALFALLIAATFTMRRNRLGSGSCIRAARDPGTGEQSALHSRTLVLQRPKHAEPQHPQPANRRASPRPIAALPQPPNTTTADAARCRQSQRPITRAAYPGAESAEPANAQRRWRFRLQYPSHLCPACRRMVPCPKNHIPTLLGSTYIPVDSIVYPLTLRLYSLGYLDDAFIAMRPWTRRSLLHMLEKSADDITSDGNSEAVSILAYLQDYLIVETPGNNMTRGAVYGVESVYTRLMGVGGPVLRDSFHLGQTIYNDYGRPYATGFNNVTGFESVNEYGRFSLYVRGEYQHAPAYQGYSLALANQLSCLDEICPFVPPNNPQDTIPYGSTNNAVNTFRLQAAYASFHWWGQEISFGKTDNGGDRAWAAAWRGATMPRIPIRLPRQSRRADVRPLPEQVDWTPAL